MIKVIQNTFDKSFDATIAKLPITKIWDNFDRDFTSNRQHLTRIDIYIAIAIGLVGASVCLWALIQTNRVPELHTTFNLWLHADVARYTENLVSTGGSHGRTSVHPLFSILLYPLGATLTALGLEPLTAAKTLIVIVMGANAALFSIVVRLLGLDRIAVILFSIVFVTTATFLFWSAVVESFQFAGFSVLFSLFMMFRVKDSHWGWWVLLNVLTLGFLITNWVFALVAMAVRLKLKPFIAIGASSFALVVALSLVQNATFERAAIFLNPETLLREQQYLQPTLESKGDYDEGFRPSSNLRSIYITTVVAMPVYVRQEQFMRLATTNQNSAFPEDELVPIIAVIVWIALFGLGIWGAVRSKRLRLPLIGCGAMLAAQTCLHLVYGEVTFLYSMSFMPMIIVFAAAAYFSPYRLLSLILAGSLIVTAGINNERRFQHTVEVANCVAKLPTVQQVQVYSLIRDNPPEVDFFDPELAVDTKDVCGTKSPL